jgi:hypothetical protein
MNFPEYLKERLSEDYKNLIIQKLEEIKKQTEELKNTISPSVLQANQNLRDSVTREIARIQEILENQLNESQQKISSDFSHSFSESMSSWYHSDISSYQQQLDMLIGDIVSNVPVPEKKEQAELGALVDLVDNLDQGNTQSDILNIVLKYVSGLADRAVLFVVRGEQAAGWAAFGLGDDWDTQRIRGIKVDLTRNHVLHEVVATGRAAGGPADRYFDNLELFSMLGAIFPQSALATPIMVRGKMAGILYADMHAELKDKPDVPNCLYLASRLAGSAIDLLPLKANKPATAPAATAAAPVAAVATPEPAAAAPAPAAKPVMTTPVSAPVIAPIRPVTPAPEPPDEIEYEPSTQSMAPARPAADEEDVSGTVIMEGVRPPEPAEPDQKLHDDAKRFARLLVSEIKLYNEAQVSAGRENRDLYDRLKEDIERSRRMYVERVPYQIHSTTNYFYEELVRTLANGDPTLLGM